jgi:hypothetical protein
MFDRVKRSFDLIKASATVLKSDRQLLVFPLISGCAMLAVVLCFALPMFGLGAFDGIGRNGERLSTYSLGFLFYVVQYFVIFYFNAALVACVLMRLDGATPTVKDGLRAANSRIGVILGYAVISATVGVILRTIEERVGFLGRFITGLFGVVWNVATFLVVPVLVARNVGPVQSIKDSAMLLKGTWGENVAGQVSLGVAFSMIQMAIIVSGIALIGTAVVFDLAVLAIPLGVFVIAAVLVTVLLHTALSSIYSVALFRYASNGDVTIGFEGDALNAAFLPKK